MAASARNADGPIDSSARPGWTTIVELVAYLIGEARHRDEHKREIQSLSVQAGRLRFEVINGSEEVAGLLAAAESLSAETCELCGGKGNPVGDGRLQPRGCRCEGCLGARLVRLARDWSGMSGHPAARNQRGQGVQIGLTRSDGDLSGRKDPDRQETTNCKHADLLMKATDDELATIGWVGGAGWAGLIRALFLTLCPEPGYPPDDPSLALRRIEDMKEKYGELAVYLASYSPYQQGACMFIETISAYVCLQCEAPGELRDSGWIRAECNACWAKAGEKSRASARKWHGQSPAAWASRTEGFRGTKISW